MSETYMFTKLLPKEALFVRGESPSPDKLNGIFNQINSAMFMLESFLGNGTDYRITSDTDRKMLFNVSSALGRTDKLYKPANRIPDIKRLDDKFSGAYGTFNQATDTLTITDEIIFPAEIKNGDKVAVYYTGQPVFTIGATITTLPEKASFGWEYITTTEAIDYFYLKPASGKTLVIRAIYIAETDIDGECYNIGYSIPLDNANYYTVKVPCYYSNPANTLNTTKCASKTCNYCIGNTYNLSIDDSVTYGTPICSGAVDLNSNPINYLAETGNLRATYLTLQSPVNTTNNAYSLKYRPFKMHSSETDDMVILNKCMIYDIKDAVSPMKYTSYLYSAGGANSHIRGDIFYTTSSEVIQVGDNKRYLVLGGSYGVVDLAYDMMTFIERQVPLGVQIVGPAVYD